MQLKFQSSAIANLQDKTHKFASPIQVHMIKNKLIHEYLFKIELLLRPPD